jgi:VWFA-related protein
MRRAPAVRAAALAALVVTPLAAQDARKVPAFPTKVEALTVDVVVLDKSGQPVRGLAKEDFTVLEDGRPQSLVAFEAREVVEGGEAQPPLAASNVATNEGASAPGRAFAFLIDDLGLDPLLSGADVKKTIARWIEEKADPRDDVTLATTSGSAWWSDRVERGRGDLLAVLGRVAGQRQSEPSSAPLSEWEAFRIATYEGGAGSAASAIGIAQPTGAACTTGLAGPGGPTPFEDRVIARWFDTRACLCIPESIPLSIRTCRSQVQARAKQIQAATTHRGQALLAAVERLSRGLAGWRGRKSILIFSEGILRDPHLEGVERAIDASQRGNTAVYFVDARGLRPASLFRAENGQAPSPADIATVATEESVLETAGTEYVAEATGGATVRDTNDLLEGMGRLAAESSAYYMLGYQPERAFDGKWRKIEVKVARPGVTIRARRGYSATAPLPTMPSKGRRPLDAAVVAGGDRSEIPLRSATYVLDTDDSGGVRLLVAMEVDTSKLAFTPAGELSAANLDLTLVGVSRDFPKLFPVDERVKVSVPATAVGGWWVFSREIHLLAGVAQVRALVRDLGSGLTGSVTQRIEVPALNGPFLASPILTDRLVSSSSGQRRLVPVAHRTFRPSGRLYCGYDIHGAAQATIGYSLQAQDGKTVSVQAPSPVSMDVGGRSTGLLAVSIDGLDDGPYELVLEAQDAISGAQMMAREPFLLEHATTRP